MKKSSPFFSAVLGFVASNVISVGYYMIRASNQFGADCALSSFLFLTFIFTGIVTSLGMIIIPKLALRSLRFALTVLVVLPTVSAPIWLVLASQIMWAQVRELDLLAIPVTRIWAGSGAVGLILSLTIYIWKSHSMLTNILPASIIGKLVGESLYVLILSSASVLMLWITSFTLNWTLLTEHQVILLEDGFTGPILIVYEQSTGNPILFDGRSRLYSIPSSGVLKTAFTKSKLVTHTEVYYISANGERVKVPFVKTNDCSNSEVSAILVCPLMTISAMNQPPHDAFLVGYPNEFDRFRIEFDDLFDAYVR